MRRPHASSSVAVTILLGPVNRHRPTCCCAWMLPDRKALIAPRRASLLVRPCLKSSTGDLFTVASMRPHSATFSSDSSRRCLLLSGSRIAMRMSSTRFCDVSGGVTAVQNTVQTQTIDHDGGADTSKRAGAAAGSHDEPMSATARAPVRRAPLPATMNNYSCTEM